jgi:hypothetical protein
MAGFVAERRTPGGLDILDPGGVEPALPQRIAGGTQESFAIAQAVRPIGASTGLDLVDIVVLRARYGVDAAYGLHFSVTARDSSNRRPGAPQPHPAGARRGATGVGATHQSISK